MTEPLTIAEAAPLLKSREITPVQLLDQCLKRIDAYEPEVKAWAYIDRERALRDAQTATEEIQHGRYRGPLHGIPFGIKDIIDVYDMPTGCGSKLWANSIARNDAACVRRLRESGAILLGKTVTTAYAYLDPSATRNPWNLDRTPGGSSSGSAAAVACGMCLAAIGTQTGGSLTRPASFCGVSSLKPRYGRVSVEGVLPLAASLDHIGIMANGIRDLAFVYDAMAVVVNEIPEKRIFQVAESIFPDLVEPQMTTALKHAMSAVEHMAFQMPHEFGEIPKFHLAMMAHDAAQVHSERLKRHPDDYPPKIAELIHRGEAVTAEDYADALKFQRKIRSLVEEKLVFLATPAATGPAPTRETTGNPAMNSPWSFLGFPTVSMPVAKSADGLPMSIQIAAKRGQEHELLKAAAWLEERIGYPRSLPPIPA
jgi:aspartyl-tRNA(Asn)/glutamyl-tRNA(Gln) amidotransferase subunit A